MARPKKEVSVAAEEKTFDINGKVVNVELTFQKDILGSWPSDPEIAETYIASKAPDAETMAQQIENLGVDAVTDSRKTIFPRDKDGNPIIYDYQIRGFFKAAAKALYKLEGSKSSKIKAYKQTVDTKVFIVEEETPIIFDGEIDTCQRPLRASTPQGDRVALAFSESIHKGAKIIFGIRMLDPSLEDVIYEWLDYGQYNGLGQWRNAGYGKFTWRKLEWP